ncbi:MAG: hypothetical protein ACFFDY_05610 [Candidatus Thorarchaeota archaeon]
MIISKVDDTEPVLNLKDLFYEPEIVNKTINKPADEIQYKTKQDNFKLLTDIQNVLINCRHLTSKDKLLYCQSQRYFMKQFLREINKR